MGQEMKRKQPDEAMPCPRCKRFHRLGVLCVWEEKGRRVMAPPDVFCPCGLRLRYKRTPDWLTTYGWRWGIVAQPPYRDPEPVQHDEED